MSTQPQQFTRPIPGVMFGLTHAHDLSPIIREQKLCKIGIGQPKGPAIMVWIENDATGNAIWRGSLGYKASRGPGITTFSFEGRKQAETWYRAKKQEAPMCNFPRKLPFFLFTRQVGDGSFEPDFDAIEAHGPTPTEIDIIFLTDNPLQPAYQMWSKSELRCTGDGINAERSFSLAKSTRELELVEIAKQMGARMFPVETGCWTTGCTYPVQKDGCKPHADLKFQLVFSLRVGGTAYFTTTGMKTIQQLFSSLQAFKALTGAGNPENGRVAGVPFKMTVRPYQTNHEGQPATQYGVNLEFRAKDVAALQQGMIEQAQNFRQTMRIAPATARIAAPLPMLPAVVDAEEEGLIYEDEAAQAAAMHAEFDGGEEEEQESAEAEPVKAYTPAVATQSPLAEKIKRNTRKQQEPPVEQQANAQTQPTPESPSEPDKPATTAPMSFF